MLLLIYTIKEENSWKQYSSLYHLPVSLPSKQSSIQCSKISPKNRNSRYILTDHFLFIYSFYIKNENTLTLSWIKFRKIEGSNVILSIFRKVVMFDNSIKVYISRCLRQSLYVDIWYPFNKIPPTTGSCTPDLISLFNIYCISRPNFTRSDSPTLVLLAFAGDFISDVPTLYRLLLWVTNTMKSGFKFDASRFLFFPSWLFALNIYT